MAEEESKGAQEEVAKEGKPWLALLLMLLVVPVVTLAITEFVVIPRLQESLGSGASAEKQPKAAGGHGGEEAAAGGHGGAKVTAELGGAGNSYAFEELVANLAGTMGTRFLKVSFEVRGVGSDIRQVMRVNKPIILDAIISALSSESIQSLEMPGGRNRLRLSLIKAVNESLNADIVEELYFTEFMIQ
jgi:flagellar FliL protein